MVRAGKSLVCSSWQVDHLAGWLKFLKVVTYFFLIFISLVSRMSEISAAMLFQCKALLFVFQNSVKMNFVCCWYWKELLPWLSYVILQPFGFELLFPPFAFTSSQFHGQLLFCVCFQLATAMENLKHIFTVPESVRRTEELINDGKLLHAHKQ